MFIYVYVLCIKVIHLSSIIYINDQMIVSKMRDTNIREVSLHA